MPTQTKHIFTFVRESDEAFELKLNGNRIGCFSREVDGWLGMDAVEHLIARITAEIGAQLQTNTWMAKK